MIQAIQLRFISMMALPIINKRLIVISILQFYFFFVLFATIYLSFEEFFLAMPNINGDNNYR